MGIAGIVNGSVELMVSFWYGTMVMKVKCKRNGVLKFDEAIVCIFAWPWRHEEAAPLTPLRLR